MNGLLIGRCRQVRDPMFRCIRDPFLIMGAEHRGLNIGVPQHVLDLMNGRAALQRDRGRRVPERVGGDPSRRRQRPDRLIEQAGLSEHAPHHGFGSSPW